MKTSSVAPCGLICDLCSGFQRKKDTCVGCNAEGNKNTYCQKCSIKNCVEKHGDSKEPCFKCEKYPCRRIKDLNKRYSTKYGESLFDNFDQIQEIGIRNFISKQKEEWKCPACGELLCVHKTVCVSCGAVNHRHPANAPESRS